MVTKPEILTAAAREHLSVWAKLDAVYRAMVALQDIPLRAIETMYPDPLVGRAAGDEPILQGRVDGSR